MTDLTRTNELMQKKGICVFAGMITEGAENGNILAATGNHLLGNLPPDAVITNAYAHVKTASDAATTATLKLGTASGGAQLFPAVSVKTTGKKGTFAGQLLTDTGVELGLGLAVAGATTEVGEYLVVVEYLEFTKNTGEYTAV